MVSASRGYGIYIYHNGVVVRCSFVSDCKRWLRPLLHKPVYFVKQKTEFRTTSTVSTQIARINSETNTAGWWIVLCKLRTSDFSGIYERCDGL